MHCDVDVVTDTFMDQSKQLITTQPLKNTATVYVNN